MTAGKRSRLVTFERSTPTENEYGEQIAAWATYATAFAEVLFGTGAERREAAQEGGTQAATFICEWGPTLDAVTITDRVQFDGSVWDITSRAPVGLNRELHFTATRSA